MSSSNRLESLTALRFIAAAVVLIFHFGQGTYLYKSLPAILKTGSIMVTFFFVLSGFVISVSHSKREISAYDFYKNRAARIAPIYILALIATCILTKANPVSTEFILSVTLIQAWIPPYPLSLNNPGWSISVEAFFYAISPILLIIAAHKPKPKLSSWIASAIILWAMTQLVLSSLLNPLFHKGFPSYSHDIINYFPLSHLCSFVFGFVAGIAYNSGFLREERLEKINLLMFFISIACVSLAVEYKNEISNITGLRIAFSSSFFSILFLPCIYFCAASDNIIGKIASWKPLTVLGESSYSLYILQKPLFLIFLKILPATGLKNPDAKFLLFFSSAVLLSVAFYFLLEKPAATIIKIALKNDKEIIATPINNQQQ